MNTDSRIYIAGHTGMVGSSILRILEKKGFSNLFYKDISELDLRDGVSVSKFFNDNKPEYVFLAAAKVGGILANMNYPAEFIYDNLQIQNNVIHNSYLNGVKKLLFLGSTCIYPKNCPQPMSEEHLLSGKLEETNEPYAIAKIAGIKMCQSYNRQYGTNFIACMPTNLYGPNDNFDLETSHVLPALIRKFYEAKQCGSKSVTLWGDGSPMREFLHVDDMADACFHIMNKFEPTVEENMNGEMFLNIGIGEDISIIELAKKIQLITGFKGRIIWDSAKPNGTLRKLTNISRLAKLGRKHNTNLSDGLNMTYTWYLNKISNE